MDETSNRAILNEVAALHDRSFRHGLGGSLGIKFARAFYSHVVRSDDCFLIVALDGGRLAGYLAAAFDNRAFPPPAFRTLLRKQIVIRALTGRLSYTGLLRALRNRRLGRRAEGMAELLSIQTCEGFGGMGVARALIDRMTQRLLSRGVGAWCVFTDKAEAISFYRHFGLQPIFQVVSRGVPSACLTMPLQATGTLAAGPRRTATNTLEPGPLAVRFA